MNSLILPKHILDTKRQDKNKKEVEKIPEPTGFRIVILPLTLKAKTKAVYKATISSACGPFAPMVITNSTD